jgi:hypothetical protein
MIQHVGEEQDLYKAGTLGLTTALIKGAKWGPGVALISGTVLAADFIVAEPSNARSCAVLTGYTPWVLQSY